MLPRIFWLLWFLAIFFVIAAPFTKVEESFNLQATHDLLRFWPNWIHDSRVIFDQFDHVQFPGVVPRTFLGALILGACSLPVYRLIPADWSPVWTQILIRCVLATLNTLALARFTVAIQKRYGSDVSRWFILLLGTQFHFLFYASRTLPNFFAMFGVLMAMAFWIESSIPSRTSKVQGCGYDGSWRRSLICWGVAMTIFRAELIVLIACIVGFEWAIMKRIQFWDSLKTGLVSCTVSLVISVLIDSYFWQRWLYPEGEVLYLNTVLNRSHEWGVSPFHAYFTSHLPKLLLLAYPLSLGSLWLDYRVYGGQKGLFRFALTSFAFVFLYSFLGHKEWRFIVYTVPLLTLCAAHTADFMWKRKGRFWKLVLLCGLAFNLAVNVHLLYISSWNYPGGYAVTFLNSHLNDHISDTRVNIHLDVLTCTTGASQFIQQVKQYPNQNISISMEKDPFIKWHKTETHQSHEEFIQYDYLITERPDWHRAPIFSSSDSSDKWEFVPRWRVYAWSRASVHANPRSWPSAIQSTLIYVKKSLVEGWRRGYSASVYIPAIEEVSSSENQKEGQPLERNVPFGLIDIHLRPVLWILERRRTLDST